MTGDKQDVNDEARRTWDVEWGCACLSPAGALLKDFTSSLFRCSFLELERGFSGG